jgi:opacity protein-like surface antigen
LIKVRSMRSMLAVCLFFLSFFLSVHAGAQTAPDQQIPQPGELGSPFPAGHFWERIAFEFAGDYNPKVVQGGGAFGAGYGGTGGVIDRLSPRWNLLAEFQFLSQQQSVLPSGAVTDQSTFISTFDLAGLYEFRPHEMTSPYVLGGAGFYHLTSPSGCVVGCPADARANSAGFLAGAGVRHRLNAARQTSIFAEVRYQYIASGSTAFGQISLLPISAGIRW